MGSVAFIPQVRAIHGYQFSIHVSCQQKKTGRVKRECTSLQLMFSLLGPTNSKTVTVTYIEPSGDEKVVQAQVGKNLLDIAHDNDIELEGA